MKKLYIRLSIFLVLCLFVAFVPKNAFATEGDISVTVTDELGLVIPDINISIMCTGGENTFVGTTSASGVLTVATTSLQTAGDYEAALCGDGYDKDITITATSTYYVASTTASTTNTVNTFYITGVPYTLKVTAVIDELDADVMPTTGDSFTGSDSLIIASSSYSGGAWYLAASSTGSGGTLTAISDGYINSTSTDDIETSSTTQKTITFGGTLADYNESALKYLLKVLTYDELGASLSNVIVTHGGTSADATSSNISYFKTSSGELLASKDGYVSLSTTTDSGLSSITTNSASSSQTIITLSGTTPYTDSDPVSTSVTGSGLKFALKVTVQKASDSSAISGATVTTGNAYSVICSENSSTGVYYCAIPLSDSGRIVNVLASGYVIQAKDFMDRTVSTDIQSSLLFIMSAVISGSTGNNSGSIGYGYNRTPTITQNIPIISTPNNTLINPRISAVAFLKKLSKGMSNTDILSLQKFLNSDPTTVVAINGAGSRGNETNYFGSLTLKAVQKFQVKYGIAKPGEEGYGLVGPKTRAKLNQLIK